MPHITEVTVSAPRGAQHRDAFAVHVTAQVNFSEVERQIGLTYKARILLFEANQRIDYLSVYPNWTDLVFHQNPRGDKDDFLGFSRQINLEARGTSAPISHTFDSVRGTLEPEGHMKFRALVVCVPSTATAMQWSGETRVIVNP